MDSVGIVVPAYRPDIDRLADYVEALIDRLDPVTIRIELDAAEQQTNDALSALPVVVNAVDERRGKGAAITAGFEALDTDVLVFVDADGSTPADSVASVIEPVATGTADLSVGSRRHPDAEVDAHQTFVRRRLGDGFAFLARTLLGAALWDFQCGAKAISASAWREVRSHLYEPGFAWDVELIAIAEAFDYRVAEVPVVWQDQPGSTVSTVDTTIELAIALLASRHRAKLIDGHPLHRAIASRRRNRSSLVDDLPVEE